MSLIKFVRNYNDLSTDNGFQFEFFCDRVAINEAKEKTTLGSESKG